MNMDTDAVTFGGTRIGYSIRRTGRGKTIAITVSPDTTVEVAAPKWTRRKRIGAVVSEKAEWILRQQDRFARSGGGVTKELVSGESLLYLGRQYQLKVVRGGTRRGGTRVTMSRGCLMVTVPAGLDGEERREAVKGALVAWYREHAEQYVERIAQHAAKRLGVEYKSVQVREMKTRWGSGGPTGQLRFNWRIIMAPARLVEYVVAHELCHLVHGDHSQAFWRLLGRLLPDYEKRRVELEVTGARFDLG